MSLTKLRNIAITLSLWIRLLAAEFVRSALPAIRRSIFALVPMSLAFVTSVNTLFNRFAYDDTWMFLNNSFVHTPRNLPWIFVVNPWTRIDAPGPIFPYFRPLVAGLHIVEYGLFGPLAWPHHLVSLSLHVIVTALVFIFIKKLTGRSTLALIATTLFAVHPVHSEAIAWISSAGDLLVALFGLLTLYSYLWYRQSGKWRYLLLTGFFFACSLLSKEFGLLLPIVILALEIYLSSSLSVRDLPFRRLLKVYSVFCVPIVGYLLMRSYSNGGILFASNLRYPWTVVLNTILSVVLKYAQLLVVPSGYSIHHYIEPGAGSLTTFWISLFIITVVLTVLVRIGFRTMTFAFAWILLWLLPALAAFGTMPPTNFVQDRYLYLPSIGFCLAVAVVLERLFASLKDRVWALRTAQLGFAFVIAALTVVHINQNRVWYDNVSLYEHNVAVNKNSGAYASLALRYLDVGRLSDAEQAADTARMLDVNDLGVYVTSALVAHGSGDPERGIKYLEHAETIAGSSDSAKNIADLYLMLGVHYKEKSEFSKAEYYMRRAADAESSVFVWTALGQLLYSQGRFEDALSCFNKARIHASPKSGYIRLELGRVYHAMDRLADARVEYEAYMRLVPGGRYKKEVESRLEEIAAKGAVTSQIRFE